MLQWMGGSRRKVSTSRKSTQKRQKQYFEQRRRQQHDQIAGLENYDEGARTFCQNQQEHRSLDILSMANLSTVCQDRKPAFSNGTDDLNARDSAFRYCISEDLATVLANSITPRNSLEVQEARTPPGHQVETGSPKNPPGTHSSVVDGIDKNLDLFKAASQQQLSVFDLLNEDGVDGELERFPVSEAHVAFSVEGLGKIGAETPVHSPQPARSCSPLKSTRRLNTSRSLGYVLDDIGLEVDPLREEIGTPFSASTLKFSTGTKDSFSNLKMNVSTFQDHMQLDGHNTEIRGSPSEKRTLHNTGHSDNIWEARSSILDVNILEEMDSDIFRKSWPRQMGNISSDFLKYGNAEVPEYGFQSPYRPYKREASRATERFSFLDSPAPKHHISGDGHDFLDSRGARHPSTGTSFRFGDVIDQSDRTCFMTEAKRDNLNSTSEESCSSTAVIGEPLKVSLPNHTAKRYSRKQQNCFGSPEISYGGDDNFAQEKHSQTRSKILEQNNEWGSRKSKWPPNLAESKSACKLDSSFQDLDPNGAWLFDGGYSSAETKHPSLGPRHWKEDRFRPSPVPDLFVDAEFSSSISKHGSAVETKHPSLGPRHWNEDRFRSSPVPDLFVDAEFSSNISKHGSAVKFPPSGSFISGECALCPPLGHVCSHGSPKVSRLDFGATKQKYSPDFPNFELEDRPPISSRAVSCTEPFIPDLLAQQSVSKLEGKKSKFPQDNHGKVETRKDTLVENMMTISASDTVENGPGCKEEKDQTSETSSSVKIPDRPQTNVDEKRG